MSTPLSDEQIAEIKARTDKATPGPWGVGGGTTIGLGIVNHKGAGFSYDVELAEMAADYDRTFDVGGRDSEIQVSPAADDAEFIAHARQDVPALLAEVERLRTLASECSCSGLPQPEGPAADCPVHGAIAGLNEAIAEVERLKAENALLRGQVSILRGDPPEWIPGVTKTGVICHHGEVIARGTYLNDVSATGTHPECFALYSAELDEDAAQFYGGEAS